jgi:manganese transport system substrate-binding protein
LLVLITTFAVVTACGTAPAEQDDDRPLVLTTFTVLADIAGNVSGDLLRIESITKPGAEIHGYEPTPSDLRNAEGAALILDNGLGLESWFEKFVANAQAPHVVLTEGITPIPIREDAYAGRDNPHAWMSPRNAQVYVNNIADAFAELDPENAETYRANAADYNTQLAAIEEELVTALAVLPDNERALVTCEGAFSYLARDLNLQEGYLWAVNAEQQGTPQQVGALIGFVRDNEVPAVFCESTVSDSSQQQVARETGARFGGTLYVDSLSEADGPVPTYLELLRYDARTIIEGLTGDQR